MSFNVENASGSALDIDDLGITLETGEITDLSLRAHVQDIINSAQVGEEISVLINAGDLIIKDPLDGTTNLSIADGIACARSYADPNYRVGVGAILGNITDVNITTPADEEVLTYDSGSGDWINAPGGGGGSHPVAITTINGQLVPTFVDTTRASKILSVSEQAHTWADNKTDAGDWLRIGVADDAGIGMVMPLDGTIVRTIGIDEDNANKTMGVDLYVNGVLNTTDIVVLTGSGQQTDRDETLNIDFSQDDILHLRASLTATGEVKDLICTLWVRWRG